AQEAKAGSILGSYFDDFYFRIHIMPSSFALGSLASEQTRNVEVWNAWPQSNTLTQIDAAGGDGIYVYGPYPEPTTFGACEDRQYELAVTTDGPPTFDATFSFLFALGTGALRVTGRRIIGWAVPPNWVQPLVERLEWLTDVLESHAGVEQRVRLRGAPRRSLEYRLLVGNDRDRVRVENLLLAWQARVYALPVWTDAAIASSPIAAGATAVAIDTSNRAFAADELVAFVLGSESEIVEVASLTVSSITLKTPLQRTWPAGTRIVPARPARLRNDLRITHEAAALADATVVFDFEDEWQIDAAAPAVTYRGHPVLLDAHDWAEALDADYIRKTIQIDHLTGRRLVDDLSGVATVRRTHRWLLNGRASIVSFRRWLAARAGRLAPFWLPSGQSDLRLTAAAGAADTAITVENTGYAALVNAAVGRRDIMITTTSGQRLFARIIDADEIDAQTEQLALESAIGTTVLPQDVMQISFMRLVRLDADAVEIAHHTDEIAEAVLSLRSLRDDL
ncbi:hypothetical protein MOJ79_06390, partial [Calidifontimicrobium sp. SYSU G02091]|uniref:hypothetical protein n=1 Tax=Calidifontimicrobium sp. SYSU G02091 TaxID=2926421 RepID=UPI001F537C32